jgi:type IV pilus assembly protein PilA
MVCWAGAEVCKGCGNPLVANAQQNYGYAYAQGAPSFASGNDGSNKRKGMAVASLVLGIISLPTLGLLGVGALLGITFGIFALMRAKREPSEYGGRGLAIGGIVTSVLSLTLAVPVGIVAAIAIPNLLAARRAANEGSAIHSMRRLVEAEQTFLATTGAGQRFGSMAELREAELIDEKLAQGFLNDYHFSLIVLDDSFSVSASPMKYPSTGTRSFYLSSDEMIIRAADKQGHFADANDPPLPEFRTRGGIAEPASPASRINVGAPTWSPSDMRR